MSTKGIDIHHSAIYAKDNTAKQFDIVNNSHHARFGESVKSSFGFYVGYHYFIERDGEVKQARLITEVGAHDDAAQRNFKAIGICFAGNMELQKVTNEQVISMVELVRNLQKDPLIDKNEENYQPHRHWKATACPGHNIPDAAWPFLRDLYAELKAQEAEPEIMKWNKANKVMEQWSSPPTREEIDKGWLAYKLLKLVKEGKVSAMDFNL